MATQAAEALGWMSHKEIDAALPIVDEGVDAFHNFERSRTIDLPTRQSKTFQALPGLGGSGASVASGDSGNDLARREKARQKERRRYYRNKQRMSDLQRQVEMLECQLWALSSSDTSDFDDLEEPLTTVEQPGEATDAQSAAQDSASLCRRRLGNAIRAAVRLRNENTLLRHKFREELQRKALLTDLLSAEHKLYLASSTSFRLLKPMTPKTCAAVHADCIKKVDAFTQELSDFMPLSGCLSGWREMRLVEGHLFKFKITKKVCNFTSKTVFSRFWTMLQDPTRYARLYSDVLNAEARLIQKVDDDNLVFYEEMCWMDSTGTKTGCAKAVLLLSQLETPTGYRIQMRGLDRDQVVVEDLFADTASSLVEVWNTSEMLWWIDFDSAEDACVVSFAGTTSTAVSPMSFWAAEVMRICLRGEHATIGTRFSLPE